LAINPLNNRASARFIAFSRHVAGLFLLAVRFMTQSDQNTQESAAPDAPAGTPAEAGLEEQLREAQAKAAEHFDAFVRAKAETENIRRRAQEDVSKAHKFGIESFAEALVPVQDSLEMALADTTSDPAKLKEGVQATLRQLRTAFEKNHLKEIAPAAGDKFDPHQHQAISMIPSSLPAQTVVNTLQKGFLIADRVLRPALVTVSNGEAPPAATPNA
jgi:molecular chaperone GrpE